MSRSRRSRLAAVAAAASLGMAAAGSLAAAAQAAPAPAAAPRAAAATHRVLFDNTEAETAGNADWVISTSQPDPLGEDSSPSAETDWTGALSSWGVALQRSGGYTLDTLPSGSTITYGGSGALDLKNFDTFVLPEPNIRFTAAEKTAIMKFVQNGGGLFLISDHTGSDRNNDGYDSPKVINDLMTSNGVDDTDPFGFSVDSVDISSGTPRAISDSSNPVLNGPFGKVTGSTIADGTTFTLKPGDNPAVKGLVWKSGANTSGTTGAFFVTSTFGSGRVAIWGDSSPIDDGTGHPGDTLYDGWNDTGGTNAALALNATAWLSGDGSTGGGGTTPPGGGGGDCGGGQLLANPGFESGATGWSASDKVITNSSDEPARSGSYKAWLDGYGAATTNTLSQSVSLPAGCPATLSYWLHVDTDETGSTAYDTLKVQVLNASGTVLGTVGSWSNTNAAAGYQQHTADLGAYAGQRVTLRFTGTEGSKLQTSFVVDDTSLTTG
ncbi:immune inhibitor A [Streptomyces fuscigenes]|uniref:immune inhibitor A n=1 Tax=Streptomyces fuscigenes TaxID=1528880 RepID=UPI001F3BE5EF|nr:immune inhibitor A [Streptomyces fuscigenes]MCF3962226.1 immune inhibitor A [Streptomyces fuscigenes]